MSHFWVKSQLGNPNLALRELASPRPSPIGEGDILSASQQVGLVIGSVRVSLVEPWYVKGKCPVRWKFFYVDNSNDGFAHEWVLTGVLDVFKFSDVPLDVPFLRMWHLVILELVYASWPHPGPLRLEREIFCLPVSRWVLKVSYDKLWGSEWPDKKEKRDRFLWALLRYMAKVIFDGTKVSNIVIRPKTNIL